MRSYILASADDDVLDPAGQVQIGVLIKPPFVAGTKPSMGESASVGFGIVVISAKYIGALNGDFAALPGGKMIALFVQDADAKPGADSYRTGFAMSRRQRVRSHLMGRLRHAVGFDEGH